MYSESKVLRIILNRKTALNVNNIVLIAIVECLLELLPSTIIVRLRWFMMR